MRQGRERTGQVERPVSHQRLGRCAMEQRDHAPKRDAGLLEVGQEAADQKLPAYCVFTDATLIAIAEARPSSVRDLVKVQGLGPTKADKYGEHLLAIIAAEADRTRSSS